MSETYKQAAARERAAAFGAVAGFGTVGTVAVVIILGGALFGCPSYNVYAAHKHGEAELARASQNRQIRVQEAQAIYESSKLTALAEIERAKGTEASNEIMQRSLGGPENYLRWSYIHMLEETAGKGDRQVIYVPTEANMPLMEAGSRK